MTQIPGKSAPPAADVKIRTSAGKIGVTSSALFECNDDATLHTLMERLFQFSAVDVVSVDRDRASVEIGYDRRQLSTRAALQTFSGALIPAPLAGDLPAAPPVSLLRPCLAQLPGRVKRVERRREGNGKLDWVTSAPAINGRIVTLLPSPATETPVDMLIVDFDSPTESAVNGARAESTRVALRHVVLQEGRRYVNLAAAGGCFVMSIVGVVTPGIPTVPFVLATGYFLARSSPTLHERFKRSAFFGQMVRDYEERGGLRWITKLKMILLTVGLIVITVIVAGGSLPLLIVTGAMGGLGIYMLNRIPTIQGPASAIETTPVPA
jgi:uncharacterized membrane protein YbaN (DUF454 family)